ncbi:hypothetical protein CMI47_21235 [Candidatus Pacearchaeota archaeon]|jgi:hypothetical protein|nr:hypothetical protein [Candidatus Pacearchaeota archaeon]|tara:strand:- start:2316 stop:3119 length:804 start_codon:yes stop_codon:yes gene_type:complete
MSIKDNIKQAQEKAASEAVRKGLESHRGSLVSLDEVLNKPYGLEAVLTSQGDDQLLVLPVHTKNQVGLEETLISAVKSELVGYRPKESKVGEYTAFRVSTSQKNLPKSLDLEVDGVAFKVDIVKQDVDFSGNSQKKDRKYFKQVEYKSLPKADWYQPPVKRNDEFVIVSKTASSEKYNLISLARKHSGDSVDNFPGFQVPFEVRYEGDSETTKRVASSNKDVKVGEHSGNQFFLNRLMKAHDELSTASEYTFKTIKPGEVYDIIKIS